MRRLARPMPLRTGLVLVLVALVALGLVAAGGATIAALDRYLVGELDQRLVRGALAIAADGVPPPILAGDAPTLQRLFSSSAAFVLTDAAGDVRRDDDALLPDDGPGPDFPRWDLATVRARGAEATDIGSSGPGPRWRVLAMPLADGSGSVLVAFSLADVDATLGRLGLLELLIGLVVVLLVAALAHLVVRRSLRPLTEVERIAAAVAAGEIHLRVPERDPCTEVGRLGRALNVMLGRIETALHRQRRSEEAARESEERMRRFIADAGHELRTPLTSIRGFAELHRQGAAADPDRLMGRIESEAVRMGELITDLLMLARMNAERVLLRSPVELSALAADAVHDAQAVHPTRLVRLDAAHEVVVDGDENQLRQVLANLVGNALQHTPQLAEVVVRVRERGAEAHVEVADDGPGLAPEHAARVFERFYRADASRSRASGGTGLGLSIVAAIAAAHGGRVELDTVVGRGAVFRVRLPLTHDGVDPGAPRSTRG